MSNGGSIWATTKRGGARQATREAIVDAALRMFASSGYVGVRVEDIAKEAGVSRATFYKHFAERDEILAELFERALGGPVATVAAPEGTTVRARVRALFGVAADQMLADPVLTRFIYGIPVRHEAVLPGGTGEPAIFSAVREVVVGAARDGELAPGVSSDRAVQILGRVFEMAMRDWAQGDVDDPKVRLDEFLDIVFLGIEAPR